MLCRSDYPADNDGNVVATSETVKAHEHISTLRAWFAAAEFKIPPLVITSEDVTSPRDISRASAGREESGGGGGEHRSRPQKGQERKRVVSGKSVSERVDLGGVRI